jgi:hypothetical protein
MSTMANSVDHVRYEGSYIFLKIMIASWNLESSLSHHRSPVDKDSR